MPSPITTLVNKLFRMQQWYIGWAEASVSKFVADPSSVRFHWIIPERKAVFIADPFGVDAPDGHLIVLAEALEHGRHHGEIIRIDTRDARDSAWVRLLRKTWHLSYPFIVNDGGKRYVMPEQGASGTVSAYALTVDNEIDPHPVWTVPDCPALDTTPFFHEGRWWLFSARRGAPHWGGPLLLHYADTLAGPWQSHPLNPVVTDFSAARPGGRVAKVDGRLLRPAQDCSTAYGRALVINEIVRLTPTEYEERVVRRISPADLKAPEAVACHHLDHTERHLLVDALRYVYHPLAWWYKWRS